ncbi:hypothetical protein [Paenibacillus sp. 1781tsa1]|uniref:hypothetical protein n=1 Tax=Paenibacillus sp. 1781tsa1 TaxID=2953810 RepID=UPI00209D006F|nr:hypothetical protein [Paenibacillus sp. 1781tsa1]MCP1183023.1 hypothetical protein [Paenibacillus sp. 1781tsa1]
MRKRTIFWITGITIIFLVTLLIYSYVIPSVNAKDVVMAGTIRQIDTDAVEVELEITRKREDQDQHMVYPVVPGWGGVTFTDELDDAWYMPSSVGSSYFDQVILEKYLKGQGKTRKSADNLIGFAIPDELGSYKLRFTLRSLDGTTQPLKNPMVYYVHNEQLLGKDLSWVTGENLEIIKEYAE